MSLPWRRSVAVMLATAVLAPHARAADPSPSAVGLIGDTERIVATEQSAGWFIDEEAYRNVVPTLLESVCRTPLDARREALTVLTNRARAKGDPMLAYARAGRELTDEVEDALTAERQRRALEIAVRDAAKHCPFWAEPDADFSGRQTDRGRTSLSLETGGLIQVRRTEDTWTFGGGGAARLLVGRGFGDVSLLLGPEFGGGAMIKPKVEPTEFVINYFPAFPFVLRFNDIGWHYDAEVAPVGLFQADDGGLSYGVRFGSGVGVRALRTRGLLPWAGIALAYEHYFESGGRPAADFIRGGLRVGFVWAP